MNRLMALQKEEAEKEGSLGELEASIAQVGQEINKTKLEKIASLVSV